MPGYVFRQITTKYFDDELFDADGHPVRELSGYVRIDEE